MNLIDISGWQRGLDLEKLFAENPDLDGVIVKISGGVSVDQLDTAKPWLDWLIAHDKPCGVYHFLNDDYQNSGGAMEARYFISKVKDYLGKVVLCADYEYPAICKLVPYVRDFLDTVTELTGIKPLIYCGMNVVQGSKWGNLADHYQLWLAQYPHQRPTGFVDIPWQSGSVAPFPGFVMQQYASTGRLNGYPYNLDLDKFFGTREDWDKLAAGGKVKDLKPADPTVVAMVLMNEFGIGEERIKKLSAAGYDPAAVQAKINELYAIALSCKKYTDGNEVYLNSICKIIRSL